MKLSQHKWERLGRKHRRLYRASQEFKDQTALELGPGAPLYARLKRVNPICRIRLSIFGAHERTF